MMLYRRLPNRSVFEEMDRLQRDMNRVFSNFTPRQSAPGFPAVNLWGGEDSLVVTAEIPGISADQIDISVVGETLTIKGERAPESLPEGAFYHRQERGYGQFSRTVEVPYPVDAERVSAALENGVLVVELPRVEADKPRKITVGSRNRAN
jgi:HSP20 family protein